MADIDALLTQYGINKSKVPNHVAIIMDGNGRWAKKRLLPRNFGHRQGQKQLKTTLINCVKIGVKVLSVYTFSTENWRRPEDEVSFLLKFLKSSIQSELDELIKEGVRLRFLGDLSTFDGALLDLIKTSENATQSNDVIQLNVMLNYGARREIMTAMKSMINDGRDLDALDEADFSSYMYTAGIDDPDILIRTGGDFRMSNFMLWQCAYSELFFLDVFWPDFDMTHLLQVIQQFQSRDRRFGGLSS